MGFTGTSKFSLLVLMFFIEHSGSYYSLPILFTFAYGSFNLHHHIYSEKQIKMHLFNFTQLHRTLPGA